MNGSDDSHSCRKKTQETAQKDLDDPGSWWLYLAALDVIGRLANSA
jgi:hypothetical protein